MIDFHSHILPKIDDGSRSVEESLELLHMLGGQGISTVVATPHFNAVRESVADFLLKRERSAALIKECEDEALPRILLGAEVRYYTGISRLEGLCELCLEHSSLLLLEMPMMRWSEYIINELTELCGRGDITVVIAHMERYMKLQSKKCLKHLLKSGSLFQLNADFFLSPFTRRKALSMLACGDASFIGSDCHNLETRPPRIGEAYTRVGKKLGEDFLIKFTEYGQRLMNLN